MQQTTKYKFNLIETSDTFSPEPLNENARAIEAQLAAVRGEFAAADAAETAARQTGLAALDAARLRFKHDTYVGDGAAGKDNPTRLEFDFKPLMLIVSSSGSSLYGGHPWVRGAARGRTVQLETGTVRSVTLTWEDRAVEWVNYVSSDPAEYRLNTNNATYFYLALGIAE